MSSYYRSILNVQAVAPPALDPDAEAFLTATGITDATITSAINTLVLDLKSDGIWTKMKAIYPFVGGTATTHKFNLKDPRDLDAAFRLSFFGGITHSITGMQGNGTNGYANTNIRPTLHLEQNNVSGWFYMNQLGNNNCDFAAWGGASFGGGFTLFTYRPTRLNAETRVNHVNFNTPSSLSTSIGFFGISREVNTEYDYYHNTYSENIVESTTGNPNPFITLMCFNDGGAGSLLNPTNYSSKRYCFYSFGEGLTPTQSANFNTAVQTLQTTLSRNV
jgi:hypothetical protein